MEDVLAVYARPHDPARPVVCMDEKPYQRQCLDRRIDDLDTLNAELTAWQHATNADQRQVDWQFTTHDARIKLRRLCPKI